MHMKLLFVHLGWETFVAKDLEILRSAHPVRAFHFQSVKDLPALWQSVRSCDLTFSWFGTIHALFAVAFSKMLHKKSVVVAGGYDVARTALLPHYGALSKTHKRWGILFVFANADLLLSVSEFNRQETIANARADPRKIRLVPHGFDADLFRPVPGVPKKGIVLTVGSVNGVSVTRKGLDLFVRSAAYLPENDFVLAGRCSEPALSDLRGTAPPNVDFRGWISLEDLVDTYAQADVYAQPSRHEAFGCSVAEAMLSECVPVVSREGALPEVVGDCGLYVDSLEPKAVATKIKEALGSNLGPRARERIRDLFPLERRKAGILNAVESLCPLKRVPLAGSDP